MKRTIVLLLLFSMTLPTLSTAQTIGDALGNNSNADDTGITNTSTITVDPIKPEIFATTTLTIQDQSSYNISEANITWMINGAIKAQGIGKDRYELDIDSFDPISIKAYVNYAPGVTTIIDKTIAAGFSSDSDDPSELYMFQNVKSEIGQLDIKTTPRYPTAFQRTRFELVSKDKDLKLKEKQITWYVNGEQKSPGLVGDTEFFMMMPSHMSSTTVYVDVAGYGSQKDAEIERLPRKDPRLRFNTSQATRAAYCLADASRQMDGYLRMLERDRADIERKVTETTKMVEDNIEFLTKQTATIGDDIESTTKHFGEMGGSLIGGITSGDFKSIANSFKDIGKFILDNPLSARLKYVYDKIDYYRSLARWLEYQQNKIENQITSVKAQAEYRKKRCSDIINKKPDFSPSIRKY